MDIVEFVRSAGVVGAGGAGFPTHVKLEATAEYLIINAAECEPLLQTDQYLMRERAFELLAGILISKIQVKATKAVIAVKEKYRTEIQTLQQVIKELDADVDLHYLENFYPAGDEQMAVFEVTGRSVPPGGIPLNVGCVVSNVATMINVYEASQNIPVTEKYLSILGEVNKPGIIKVPVGISFAACLESAGGARLSEYCVIRGGPMMGKILQQDQLHDKAISKTDSALIVLPADHYLAKRASETEKQIFNRAKACIQCGQCTEQCPRQLIGHPLQPHKLMSALKFSEEINESHHEALLCCSCGVCEMYTCPMGISPRKVNVYIAGQLRKKGIRYQADDQKIIASDNRNYRKVPPARLIARLDLTDYDHQTLHEFKIINSDQVCISLSQHIGAPAEAIVKAGDIVSKGQLIGDLPAEKLGAKVHASIKGEVVSVNNQEIVIQGDKG